jgi:hypothetical protein
MKRQVSFIVGCLLFMWADTALAAQSADESVKVSKGSYPAFRSARCPLDGGCSGCGQ